MRENVFKDQILIKKKCSKIKGATCFGLNFDGCFMVEYRGRDSSPMYEGLFGKGTNSIAFMLNIM